MIVSKGKIAILSAEALSAGIRFAGIAPAIASPVAERFNLCLQQRLGCQDTSAFAHGDVVRRIEAGCREIAEYSDILVAIAGAHCITTILNQPEAMLLRERGDGVKIKRISQRVRQHDAACLR